MEAQINSDNSTKKIKLDFKDSKYATGRRKKSIARVWLKKGSGKIFVNGSKMIDYFKKRPSYNLNHTQYGDQRAKIIDYFITNEDGVDVESVSFNTQVDVYLRVKFLEDYNFRPIAGYSVRSIDGLELFGTNTFIMGVELQPANKEDCRWYRFSFPANLPAGDYFLDLGIADQNGTQAGQPLDVCRFVCHLFIKPGNNDFKGVCYLEGKFLELGDCRKQLSEQKGFEREENSL